jgi:Ca2+-binding RTX toxin-like protein
MLARVAKRLLAMLLLALVLSTITWAIAASNTVPLSYADDDSFPVTANDLKPSDCASLNLAAVVSGSGFVFGTSANELILGSSGADLIFAGGGDDCVMGGGGADFIFGGSGDDVLLGMAGNDYLSGDGGTDICNGGSGVDSASTSCETLISVP